jgi:hypothetical protein
MALADRTLAQLADAGERAGDEIATLRDTVDGLRDTVSRAETRASHAEQRAIEAEAAARIVADALNVARRAEEARKARGRLRRAWDGWRGR